MKLQFSKPWFGLGLMVSVPLTVFLEWGITLLWNSLPSRETCANHIVRSQLSPDGAVRAVTFGRDCGETTGCSTQISILSDLAPLRNETGNAFEAWDDTGNASVGSWGGPNARLSWISNRKIAIRYDPRAETWNAARVTVEGIATVDVLASPEDPRTTKIPTRPSRVK